MSRNFGDREGSNLRRPPLAVVLVAVVVIALGETGGAAMSRLKPQIERYVAARVAANPQTHGLSVREAGRDAGIELAERWVLTPLGSAAILSLVGLALAIFLTLLKAQEPLE